MNDTISITGLKTELKQKKDEITELKNKVSEIYNNVKDSDYTKEEFQRKQGGEWFEGTMPSKILNEARPYEDKIGNLDTEIRYIQNLLKKRKK